MNPIQAYKFCPKCSGDLVKKVENLLVCSKCGFEFYINPSPCNAVIIENENNEIMLVKRKLDPQKGLWDLPGGFINAYETFEDSIKREVKEELNLEVEITDLVGIYKEVYDFQGIKSPVLSIVASAKIIGGDIKAADDISGFKYFSKDEVLKKQIAFASMHLALKDYLKK